VTIIGDRIFTKLYLLGQRFLFLGIVFELFGKLAEKGFVLAGIAARRVMFTHMQLDPGVFCKRFQFRDFASGRVFAVKRLKTHTGRIEAFGVFRLKDAGSADLIQRPVEHIESAADLSNAHFLNGHICENLPFCFNFAAAKPR